MSMDQTGPTRVVLADRPGIARTALAALIAETPGLALVAKLSELEEIEPAIRQVQPDVIVVDDRLLRDGRWPTAPLEVRLIVVGVDDNPGFEARARRLGAETWIPKERADSLLPLVLFGAARVSSAPARSSSPRLGGDRPGSAP